MSATLTIIYIAIYVKLLSQQIFDGFQIRMKIQKNSKYWKLQRKWWNFVWKSRKNYGILEYRICDNPDKDRVNVGAIFWERKEEEEETREFDVSVAIFLNGRFLSSQEGDSKSIFAYNM